MNPGQLVASCGGFSGSQSSEHPGLPYLVRAERALTMTDSTFHFLMMILASFGLFFLILRIVDGASIFVSRIGTIFWLSLLVVVGGMLFGRNGAQWGLPWWIYYPVPMLMNVLLPPVVMKLNARKTVLYLALSFLSAPLIHISFSLLLGWTEYMPFWKL